jgi:hypothetical protein
MVTHRVQNAAKYWHSAFFNILKSLKFNLSKSSENPRVGSSILSLGTNYFKGLTLFYFRVCLGDICPKNCPFQPAIRLKGQQTGYAASCYLHNFIDLV